VRVLITNDDGVEAPGLHALAEAVHAAGHDVIVIAPSGVLPSVASIAPDRWPVPR
jgi:5'/3'-nucleotidase SurE